MLLRERSGEQIETALGKLRGKIAAEKERSGSSFDIAAGYALQQEGEELEQMLHRADVRMYEEKQRMKERALDLSK